MLSLEHGSNNGELPRSLWLHGVVVCPLPAGGVYDDANDETRGEVDPTHHTGFFAGA